MRDSEKHGKSRTGSKLQEALEDMFAEACLSEHKHEEAGNDCLYRAKELYELVSELVQIYAVARAWEKAGDRRAYNTCVYVGPDGIRKDRDKQWRRTTIEATPRPHANL